MSAAELDASFYGYILGVQSPLDCSLNGFEKDVLGELDRLLRSRSSRSSLVPRLPEVMPRVMRSLRDPDSSAADLAAEIGRDAVLVSEVIRLANSPYYRVGERIDSLERAVFLLGRVGIRQLVASAAFKPLVNLTSGHFTRLSGTLLWQQSEKSAIAADCLARRENADRFSAYLAAIVQNVGFTVALQVLDDHFDASHAPHSEAFRTRFVTASRRLATLIATEWAFPVAVLDALEDQVQPGEVAALPPLSGILYMADKLAKLYLLTRKGHYGEEAGGMACRLQGLLTDSCAHCYQALSRSDAVGDG
ncbi:MAG TPA: HDOD domain-containing protein [Gammaproteobacteria bacterium]|nr:HDOD domain-containing protein [Gammaproteobacteria bacterium]